MSLKLKLSNLHMDCVLNNKKKWISKEEMGVSKILTGSVYK